jgi:hypothetical protein
MARAALRADKEAMLRNVLDSFPTLVRPNPKIVVEPDAVGKLPLSGEELRGVRAIEVFERANTAAARRHLTEWAGQTANPRLAAEAAAALRRLPQP